MIRPRLLLRARMCAALVTLLLVSCAHTPKPHYYVLSGPREVTNNALRSGPPIGLGPVTLPDYLDRPQIVSRASDSRLALSNEHRWAEPLTASFSRALLAGLENALPTQHIVLHPWRSTLEIARQVQIEVTRFERDAHGAFRLSARWSVSTTDNRTDTGIRQLDIEIPVAAKGDDYDALLAAANSAVAALATTLATQLQAP